MAIDILMATYNGENFIEGQLLSLLGQTYRNWTLFIHDDGSVDNTVQIIQKYQKIDNRIRLIADDSNGLGPAYNFLHTLKFSIAEYCIFCDQDDIWLENKLEIMYGEIKKTDNDKPVALYSNAYVYKGDCGLIYGQATLTFPSKLRELLFLNSGIQGCAILFNGKLREKCLEIPEYVCMHDHLLCLLAVTFGQLLYLDKRLMLYRQHDHNVTGETDSGIMIKFRSFFSKGRSVIEHKHYLAVKSFYAKHKIAMPEDECRTIEAYLAFPTLGLIGRLKLIFKYKFKIFNSLSLLCIKTIIRKPID